jgi:hypothetical protein
VPAKLTVEIAESIPEGVMVSEVALVLKCMDEDGITRLMIRTSPDLPVWDAVGMFQVGADAARRHAQSELTPLDSDEN